ncbi:septal ring lytic transglycosylase RlpA family protein [Aureivirga marina]|uniref:septal ring lytic transglycosylase RlpA family protein n=1 Tax=Aureivirga marina TaxID=1182451 RepID=UPI0018C97529|nr:septal ring lytic transglycosylase RlpA family protein [Aureivirga marina]
MKKNLKFLMFIICVGTFAQEGYKAKGKASYYNDKYNGAKTANGEKYSNKKYTAAHLTLPFGTLLKVTNPENQKSVIVRVNDRGPSKKSGRIIDLSKIAAQELEIIKKGVAEVELKEVENTEIAQDNSFEVTNETKEEIKKEKKEETKKEGVAEVVKKEDVVKEAVENIKEITSNFTKNTAEYYSLESKKMNISGFGIQIGNYKEMVNLMELSTKLKEAFGYPVHVKVVKSETEKHYKISLGNFKSKEKAANAKEKIKDKFPDCFIIEY